jgi:hypothetical protein
MKSEDQLLFACTRQNFLERHQQRVLALCRTKTINWAVVYTTAQLHGVGPLVYINLSQCPRASLGLPSEIGDQLSRRVAENMLLKEWLAEKLSQGVAFFHRRAIDVMLIKGAALDVLVYNAPWYTVPYDLDLVIRPSRAEVSNQAQKEIRTFFHRSGIEYDYFEHHDVMMNGVLPIDFHRIWADATQTEVQGYPVWVMSPEDMLISLCVNSCRKRFFRLKSLCDIAETINKYHDHLSWAKLSQKARAYSCEGIVYAALLATIMTVGCDLPANLLDSLNVNPVRAKIIKALSQRISLSAFSSLSSENVFGRNFDLSLMLPYSIYHWDQIWRKMRFVWDTRSV